MPGILRNQSILSPLVKQDPALHCPATSLCHLNPFQSRCLLIRTAGLRLLPDCGDTHAISLGESAVVYFRVPVYLEQASLTPEEQDV